MRIHEKMIEYGISLYPCNGGADGVNGDLVIISPPYTVFQRGV